MYCILPVLFSSSIGCAYKLIRVFNVDQEGILDVVTFIHSDESVYPNIFVAVVLISFDKLVAAYVKVIYG